MRQFWVSGWGVALLCLFCRAQASDWGQLQHDAARTGCTADSAPPPYRARWIWLGPELTLRNREAKLGDVQWHDDLTPRNGMRLGLPKRMRFSFAGSMQPIVLGGRVFVADAQGKVYAVSVEDGSTVWQAENPGGALWPGAGGGGVVAFASVLGYVTGYDAESGRQVWQVDSGRSITG